MRIGRQTHVIRARLANKGIDHVMRYAAAVQCCESPWYEENDNESKRKELYAVCRWHKEYCGADRFV
jgi:streptomycin 6-kinase